MTLTTSRPARLQGARRSGNQGRAGDRLPLAVRHSRGGRIVNRRTITTLAVAAVATLGLASTAAAGKPDLVKPPALQLTAIPQHDCGEYELLLDGTLQRVELYTLDADGQDIGEHRQVRIDGVVYNATDPSRSAAYQRTIQIDWDYATGVRSIAGTTRVVLPGDGILLQASGIRVEDWTGVDFETVFPELLFQGGHFDTFDEAGWDRLCAALA